MRLKPRISRKPQLTHPLARGLVGYWLHNEGSGLITNDVSGNGNYGIITGATWTSQGLSFNGSSDSVDFGDVLDQDGSTPFSIVVRVEKPNTTERYVASKQINASPFEGWSLSQSDRLFFQVVNNITNNRILASTAASTISANTLHLVAVTYDGSKDVSGVKFYIDGVRSATTTIFNTLTGSSTTTAQFSLGSRNSVTQFWDGTIDFTMIYNRLLLAGEIQALYRDPYILFRQDPAWIGQAAVVAGVTIPVMIHHYKQAGGL